MTFYIQDRHLIISPVESQNTLSSIIPSDIFKFMNAWDLRGCLQCLVSQSCLLCISYYYKIIFKILETALFVQGNEIVKQNLIKTNLFRRFKISSLKIGNYPARFLIPFAGYKLPVLCFFASNQTCDRAIKKAIKLLRGFRGFEPQPRQCCDQRVGTEHKRCLG